MAIHVTNRLMKWEEGEKGARSWGKIDITFSYSFIHSFICLSQSFIFILRLSSITLTWALAYQQTSHRSTQGEEKRKRGPGSTSHLSTTPLPPRREEKEETGRQTDV
ncbi:hypothetical protein I7I51_06761 [Histoplasma capsulatum]|uniref:Uncharacterized protein n=1 Tax=Ajellomyces capsulatus TaxID=5037 RepID=A0A8A1ML86_AJECA|nr:hypothetical protein I7I51_06761 [Histoplasma capsulatum]